MIILIAIKALARSLILASRRSPILFSLTAHKPQELRNDHERVAQQLAELLVLRVRQLLIYLNEVYHEVLLFAQRHAVGLGRVFIFGEEHVDVID